MLDGKCELCGEPSFQTPCTRCRLGLRIERLEREQAAGAERERVLQAEVDRMREGLAHIAATCVSDPDTVQFALRCADGEAWVQQDRERALRALGWCIEALEDTQDLFWRSPLGRRLLDEEGLVEAACGRAAQSPAENAPGPGADVVTVWTEPDPDGGDAVYLRSVGRDGQEMGRGEAAAVMAAGMLSALVPPEGGVDVGVAISILRCCAEHVREVRGQACRGHLCLCGARDGEM
ncbi:MAG: hypothetical protein WC683_00910 [bacterium]